MSLDKTAKKLVNEINGEIYEDVAAKSEFAEIGASFHRHDVNGDGAASVVCGREAVIGLPFIPKSIKVDLREQLDREKAKMWQGFAEQWNRENPDCQLDPGDGADWKKASAIISAFEKGADEDLAERFSEEYNESLSNWFLNEHQECDIELCADMEGGELEINLSFAGLELHSAKLTAPELAELRGNPEDIGDAAREFLADAASKAREKKIQRLKM